MNFRQALKLMDKEIRVCRELWTKMDRCVNRYITISNKFHKMYNHNGNSVTISLTELKATDWIDYDKYLKILKRSE